MFVAVFDGDADDVAGSEVAGVAEVDVAVDFGGVGFGSAGSAIFVDDVNDHVEGSADLAASFSALMRAVRSIRRA